MSKRHPNQPSCFAEAGATAPSMVSADDEQRLSADECIRATRLTLSLIKSQSERALDHVERGDLDHTDITNGIICIMECMEALPTAYMQLLHIRSCAGQA